MRQALDKHWTLDNIRQKNRQNSIPLIYGITSIFSSTRLQPFTAFPLEIVNTPTITTFFSTSAPTFPPSSTPIHSRRLPIHSRHKKLTNFAFFCIFLKKNLVMSKICCNFAPANVTTSIRGPQRNQASAVSHGESGAPEHFNKPRVYDGFGPCVRVANARNFAPAKECACGFARGFRCPENVKNEQK